MKALSGIRVLDMSRIVAGPFCTQILGDLGADIIKVEQPGIGDSTRTYGPPSTREGNEAGYYLALNRNKRSITLDLRTPEGQEIASKLAAESDVVIQNFRYGEAEKLGVGYEDLNRLNPGLIYCTISGYGPTGPYKARPGFDFILQAQSGIMTLNGTSDSPPTRVGPVPVVDITTGLYAANAVMAAIIARNNDPEGKGQQVEVSLFETALSWLANIAQNYLLNGENQPRFGNVHPNVVPYQPFMCGDGVEIVLAIATDAQFKRFCKLVGRTDLGENPELATNLGRRQNRGELIPALEKLFLTRSATEWADFLMSNDIPAGEINTLGRVMADPQTKALGIVQTVHHSTAGEINILGSPLHLSRTPTTIDRPPPALGEHTAEVLAGLGYTPEQQQALKSKKVI